MRLRRNLCNLKIALRILRIRKLHAYLKIAQPILRLCNRFVQSRNCTSAIHEHIRLMG